MTEFKIRPLRPDAVTVVCCGDRNFLAPMGVLLRSVMDLARQDRFYDLICLHSSGAPESVRRLEAMADRPNISIRCFDISKQFDISGLDTANRPDLSPMTFARLMIPELLDHGYRRALYLDADMLALRDVAALFDCSLKGMPLGAVVDAGFPAAWNGSAELRQYGKSVLGISVSEDYFSAGLLLMDLQRIRGEFSPGALMDLARSRSWTWHDQDVLNRAFQGRVCFLDRRWNVIFPDSGPDGSSIFRETLEDPWIFHFAGMKRKPWDNLSSPYADAFWNTAARTPFLGELTDRLCAFGSTYETLCAPSSGKIRALLRRILPPPVASVQRDLKNLLDTLDDGTRLLLTLMGRLCPEDIFRECPPLPDTPIPVTPAFDQAVTLVCCGDDRFAAPTAVLLRSVMDQADPNRNYDIVYLHNGLMDATRSRLASLGTAPNISLRTCDIRPIFEETGLFTENRQNFSPMAYARLLIPQILSDAYSRALYLDGDMVAADDIGKLFDLSLEGCPLGACRDLHLAVQSQRPDKAIRRRLAYTRDVLGIDRAEDYIISGMLLMDLKLLRREFPGQSLIALAKSRNWLWHDQDVINCAFRGRIKLLPGCWNLCHLADASKDLPAHLGQDYKADLKNCGIYHYAGAGEKPWLRVWHPFAGVFWATARKTSFYHLLLRRLKENLDTYHRYNPQKGGESPMLKRFLKKILPPPVNSVQRDLKYVLDAIDEQKKLGLALMQQMDALAQAPAKVPQLRLRFEYSLARHCNLNCAGCSHFSPVAPECFPDFADARRDFRRLSQLFDGRCEYIHLMGGEPLLNAQIEDYLAMAREYFPIGDIYLITNGMLLPKMPDGFYKACAKHRILISVTHYPIDLDYGAIQSRCEKHGVAFEFFRGAEAQTHFNRLALDPEGRGDLYENYVNCSHGNNCLYLRNGRMYPCGIGANMDLFEDHFHAGLALTEEDGVDIYAVSSGRELLNRLAAPSARCRFCRMDKWPERRPWGHSKKDMGEWT